MKLLLNSVISTPEAKLTMDIKNFYLNTPPKWRGYLHLKVEDIPEDVQQEYQLHEKATQVGSVHVEVCKDHKQGY